jgi:hypothetical protein
MRAGSWQDRFHQRLRRLNHVAARRPDGPENFLRCIRTREKRVLDGELGYMVQVAVNMFVESYRHNKVVFFDPESGKMVDRPMRN